MDISTAGTSVSAREEEGTVLHLRDEANEKMYEGDRPVTVTVVGSYSATYRRASEALRDRALKQRRGALDGEQLSAQALELVAACVMAWDGFTSNGSPVPLTKANAIAVLDACPWIREQVESAMHDHAAFFKRS